MASRNRGKKQQKLRDFVTQPPTSDEREELFKHLNTGGSPIVRAIIGQSLLEAMLDELLRPRFRRGNQEVWETLTSESGPLSGFRKKIELGYALNIYDKDIRDALARVGDIRNGFAHSKKPLKFSHHTVVRELKRVPTFPTKKSLPYKMFSDVHEKADEGGSGPASAFVILCYSIYLILQKRMIKRLESRTTRMKNRSDIGALASILLNGPQAPTRGLLSPSWENQIDGPKE